MRTRTVILLTLLASVFAAGASCGQSQGTTAGAGAGEQGTEGTQGSQGESGGGNANLDIDFVPLPDLPAPTKADADDRPAPSIDSIAAAETAFAQGFYDQVEQALPRFTKGATEARATLLSARLLHERGRYDEAAQAAERAGRTADLSVAARTLRAEALIARGRLDDAERLLTALSSEPTAHRARVLLGRLLIDRGRAVEARPVLMQLVDAYNNETISARDGEGLAYVAMAAWALGSVQDANDAFQEASRADADRVETQLQWARMFFEKYDTGHAEESVNHALSRNPNSPLAHALLARIKIEQSYDFRAAEEELARVARVNPNLVMAHVTRAGIALRDLDVEAADRHLDAALQVNPSDLEALSVRAAVRMLGEDDAGFERAKQEVFRRNRRYSRMYSTIAEFAEWEHRYPMIVQLAREAVTLEPDDALAHATLGLNLLRMGEEQEGLTALREAWRRDRFNVQVYNTLNLYDDVISQEYETFDEGPFVFRMHREERPVLSHYVPRTLTRAWQDMVRRYGFTPRTPVRIEMFADNQHFSVRTMGLPNLGVQGVCFGRVVTAISPRGGPFNWGQITWHELAHVFHIQLSRNRVPRWFTEGLAEYETILARPEWKRELDHDLWAALENDRLPPLRNMNRAFTHARSAEDMMTAYYASSMIVKYIGEEHGFPKIVEMLRGWGAGHRSPQVIQDALGISIDQLDRNFRQHTRQRLRARTGQLSIDFSRYTELDALRAAATAAPQDADKQAALAAGLLVAGELEEAKTIAERAVGIASGQPLARFVLARLAMMRRDSEGAEQHLRAILAGGRDGYDLRLMLARGALGREDQEAAKRELTAATTLDPERPEAWQGLLHVAEATDDADLKIRALTRLVSIDEHDRDSMAELLTALSAADRWQDISGLAEMAIFTDPGNAETHRILGEMYLRTDRAREALEELDMALTTHHERPGHVQLARARAFLRLNRRREAREAGEAARTADPSLAEQVERVLGGG